MPYSGWKSVEIGRAEVGYLFIATDFCEYCQKIRKWQNLGLSITGGQA